MNKIFIRRKKLIGLLKEKQREIRKSNQSIKIKCIEEKDKQGARDGSFMKMVMIMLLIVLLKT